MCIRMSNIQIYPQIQNKEQTEKVLNHIKHIKSQLNVASIWEFDY